MRVAAIIFGALALAGVASAADRARPVLTLGGSPLAIHGQHFHARERVLLLMTGGKVAKRVVMTDRNGAFRTALPSAFGASKCRSLTIQAIGAAGERALAGIDAVGCGIGLPSLEPGR